MAELQNNTKIEVGHKFISIVQACRSKENGGQIIKWEIPSIVTEVTKHHIISEFLEECYDDLLKQVYLKKGQIRSCVPEIFFHPQFYKSL